MIRNFYLFIATFTLFSFLHSQNAQAQSGFLRLKDSHEVYVNYTAPQAGKSTFILINGLVYDINRWGTFADSLESSGYGVLRYYFRGQSLTLRKELEKGTPKFFSTGLELKDFSQELLDIMDTLKIKKGVLVGLSYGASIAASFSEEHPERVEKLIFQAPLVVPLDQYEPQGAWLHWNLQALKLFWGPLWGPYVYDYYYNWIYRTFLGQRLVPDRIPEDMQDQPEAYKESIFHLVRATREFDLRQYRFSKIKGVHLMLASEEEEPAMKDQFIAWDSFAKSSLGSLIYFNPSWHAIPDAIGGLAADYTKVIVEEHDGFTKGEVYYVDVRNAAHHPQRFSNANSLEEAIMKAKKEGAQMHSAPSSNNSH